MRQSVITRHQSIITKQETGFHTAVRSGIEVPFLFGHPAGPVRINNQKGNQTKQKNPADRQPFHIYAIINRQDSYELQVIRVIE